MGLLWNNENFEILKGTLLPKNGQNFKNFFFCFKWSVNMLQTCLWNIRSVVRVKDGEKLVRSNEISLFWKEFTHLNSLSWKVLVLQLLKMISPIVFELQSWYWYQKKRKNVLYNVTERFFQFSNYQKNYDVWKFKISMKNPFFRKKWNNSKTNTNSKKNSLLRCRTENSASIDMNIDSVGQTVRKLSRLQKTPIFPVFCE